MRCSIIPILRAKATFARFEPRRSATFPPGLSFENRPQQTVTRRPAHIGPLGGKSGAMHFTESLRRDTPKIPTRLGTAFILRWVPFDRVVMRCGKYTIGIAEVYEQ